jgi:hypothetical protein
LHSLLKSLFLFWLVAFFSGCVATSQVVQKGELTALEKQVEAQNQYLASLAWERSHTALILQKTREDIFSLRLDVQELALRPEPALPSPPVPPPPPPPQPAPPAPLNDVYNGKKVVGAVEKVFLSPPDILLPARIDTGAATSSLDARDMRSFERDGKPWVRFHIVDPETDESVEIELPIVRHVRILQSAAEDAERRPVVELRFVIGSVSQSAQFTLSDRAHLEYPVLIGRNILQDVMVVDVGKSFTVQPQVNSSPSR